MNDLSYDVLLVGLDILTDNVTESTVNVCNNCEDEDWDKFSILHKIQGCNLEKVNQTTYFKEELLKEIPTIRSEIQHWLFVSFFGPEEV